MPTNEPIRQPIEVLYDGKPSKDAARDTLAVGDATEKAGEQADQAAGKTRKRSKGNEKLTRTLKSTELAERRAADGASDYSRSASKATGTTGLLGKALSSARGALVGMVGGFIGAAGITAALAAYARHLDAVNERLEKNAQLTRNAADAALELQFLNLVPDPTERAFAEEQAILAGRDPTEGVRAFGSLRSKNPNAEPEQLKQLLTLAAIKAQQTTAPIEDIAGGLSLLNKFTNDPRASSNILDQAITEGGELDVKAFVPLLAKFVPKGVNIGGLSAGESAGFVSGITALGLPKEEAVTSLGNILLAIKGKGTPEGAKILEREGIDRTDFKQALRQITAAFADGRIKPEELQLIGGESALTGLASLTDPKILEDLLASVGRVDEAERSESLLVSEKAAVHFGQNEIQALNLNLKQQESRLLQARQNDDRAIRKATARSIIEKELGFAVQSGEITEDVAEAKLKHFDDLVASGHGIKEAAERAEFAGTFISKFDSRRFGSAQGRLGPELGDVVDQSLQDGPDITGEGLGGSGQTVIDNRVINIDHGHIIHNGRDPLTADLDEGRPRR